MLFPGHRVEPGPDMPRPPTLPDLRFDGFAADRPVDWHWCFRFHRCALPVEPGAQLRIHADGLGTGNAAVFVDGVRVATENDPYVQGALLALLPRDLAPGRREVFIGDANGNRLSPVGVLEVR